MKFENRGSGMGGKEASEEAKDRPSVGVFVVGFAGIGRRWRRLVPRPGEASEGRERSSGAGIGLGKLARLGYTQGLLREHKVSIGISPRFHRPSDAPAPIRMHKFRIIFRSR